MSQLVQASSSWSIVAFTSNVMASEKFLLCARNGSITSHFLIPVRE